MVDPRMRSRVLQKGYQELNRLRGDLIDFDAHFPPAPERYTFKFRLKSVMAVHGDRPVFSAQHHVHVVEFIAPPTFPESVTPADIRFTTAPIFHPNVFSDGRICIAAYVPSESLGRFVLRIAGMIKFEPAFINENSAANGAAVPWYRANLRSFPVDKRPLPSLDTDTFILGQPQKKFELGPKARSRG